LGELVLGITTELNPALTSWAEQIKTIAKYWKEIITPPDILDVLTEQQKGYQKRLGNLQFLKGKGYSSDLLKHLFGFTSTELNAEIARLQAGLKTVGKSIVTERKQAIEGPLPGLNKPNIPSGAPGPSGDVALNLGSSKEYYAQQKDLLFSFHDVALKEHSEYQAFITKVQEDAHLKELTLLDEAMADESLYADRRRYGIELQ